MFLHFPGLKIAQIKIPQNVVDDFVTLTRKDQSSFGFVYASILINFNHNKFAR